MSDLVPVPWWRGGTIYQIYPATFADMNGDGVGDLAGIEARLPYVASLGVQAIWLSPIYPSGGVDGGYDVTDFQDVDPAFGDLAALDRLVDAAHGHDLKILLDFVPNHTSDRHPWFIASRSSRQRSSVPRMRSSTTRNSSSSSSSGRRGMGAPIETRTRMPNGTGNML